MTNMKQINSKEPVKIRFKKLANNSLSIYLDIYTNGIRTYEFLHLYLIPETNPEAKIINRHVLSAANAIRARRIIDIAKGQTGIGKSSSLVRIRLCQYVQHHIERSQQTHRGKSFQHIVNITAVLFV